MALSSALPAFAADAPPFVGRRAELETIQKRIESLKAGTGGRLAVQGQPGIGHSRLLREAARLADGADMQVVSLTCRGSKNHPYLALQMLLRGLLSLDPDASPSAQQAAITRRLGELNQRGHEPALLALLALDHPESGLSAAPGDRGTFIPGMISRDEILRLAQTSDEIVESHNTPDESTVISALLGLARAAAAVSSHGLVLLIDDFSEAEAHLRDTLFRLIFGLEGQHALVIVTLVPDDRSEGASVFTRDLLALSALNEPDTVALAASVMGISQLDKALAKLIWAQSKGDPLYARLISEEIRAGGRIREEDGTGYLRDGGPVTFRSALVGITGRLKEHQRLTLQHASVLGHGWRAPALYSLNPSLSEQEIDTALRALVEAGWLVQVGTPPEAVYVFANRVVQAILHDDLPGAMQTELHTRAGEYFYTLSISGRKLRTRQAVDHYMLARQPARALANVELALLYARQQPTTAPGVPQPVAELYHEALRIAASDPSLAEKRAELGVAFGDLYARVEDYTRAVQLYAEASPGGRLVLPLTKLGLALLAVDPLRALHVLSQVTPTIPMEFQDDLRWRAEAGLVWGLALAERQYESLRVGRDALARLSALSGYGFARALVRGTLGMALFYQGEQVEAQAHLESARSGWQARGDDEGVHLINRVMTITARPEITRLWLHLALHPLLRDT